MTAEARVDEAFAAIAERERTVRAWVRLDEDSARRTALALDQADQGLPLAGITLGVKDVFDTSALGTEYGSVIYRGYQPRADAAAVAALTHLGAVLLGKTVTAEFAMFTPGPTANPHRLSHTPGGSSSGSAAAVAAGTADLAIGTQTAGSVIRPASFCGVYGFKPSFGSVASVGVKAVAPSLDTVGFFARSANLLETVWRALTRSTGSTGTQPPRLALARTADWEVADADCRAAVEEAVNRAADGGAEVVERELPEALESLVARQPIVQGYEAARSLLWERLTHPDELSEGLLGILDWGAGLATDEYHQVLDDTTTARSLATDLFRDVDAIVTPAVVGEAPLGLENTGNPRFARLWTLLGWPSISVPGLSGSTGLPIGIQLIGPPRAEHQLLRYADWLGQALA